ncbi:MAG: alanine dehydrogenase [bacterium]|nr:alanine dehydrogenase [bacterium]MBU1916676.1 alanine dehydrogenase [bacterium]
MAVLLNKIGLAKEVESPENPDAMDNRVALVPDDVGKLISLGCSVSVEKGAGEAIGFSDQMYVDAGAVIQNHDDIYQNKDLLIKFKGPALEDIPLITEGTVLFCMLHAGSYPDRVKKLKKKNITCIAMEFVCESPKQLSDEAILGKMCMQHTLNGIDKAPKNLNISFIGYSVYVAGAIKRAGNRSPLNITLYNDHFDPEKIQHPLDNTVFIYDSLTYQGEEEKLSFLRSKALDIVDAYFFMKRQGKKTIQKYRDTHEPFLFGARKIQCLHETGRAGCRYGFDIVTKVSKKITNPKEAKVVVLGYGNVGMGAIHEAYMQGVKTIKVLGARQTTKEEIEQYIHNADIIVNGAEQPVELRGRNYLITNEHIRKVIPKGSAVIDLVGGSPTNRSPVEPVLNCTFLTDPYFVQDDVLISALWGWPMMGFLKETAIKYSSQILKALTSEDKLIETGLENANISIKNAVA